jgi:hypothetical protein
VPAFCFASLTTLQIASALVRFDHVASMTAVLIYGDNVIVRHLASERGRDKATARQLGGYQIFTGLFR